MKNLIKSVVLVTLCAFLFVSCEKEGQYLPKKKISRITTSTASTLWGVTTTAVTGYQDFEWSGKLLSKITLRDGDGDVYGAVVPQYDNKKRVTSLHCVTGDDIDDFKFTYDGKDLMKITRYSNDKDAVTEYSFRKDGKNVVEITVQGYSSKALDYAGINPLQFVLPQEIAEAIKPSDEKVSIIYRLAWDGKNVSSMEEIRNGIRRWHQSAQRSLQHRQRLPERFRGTLFRQQRFGIPLHYPSHTYQFGRAFQVRIRV